jgi:hypothetical protein
VAAQTDGAAAACSIVLILIAVAKLRTDETVENVSAR